MSTEIPSFSRFSFYILNASLVSLLPLFIFSEIKGLRVLENGLVYLTSFVICTFGLPIAYQNLFWTKFISLSEASRKSQSSAVDNVNKAALAYTIFLSNSLFLVLSILLSSSILIPFGPQVNIVGSSILPVAAVIYLTRPTKK